MQVWSPLACIVIITHSSSRNNHHHHKHMNRHIQVCCYHHCCCVWPTDCQSITGNTCACCILSFWPLGLVTSHVAATTTNIGETKIYRPECGSMPRLSSSARVHAAEGEGRILPFDFLHFHLLLTLLFLPVKVCFLFWDIHLCKVR